jgi:pyruvate/2-oxoglutarate dehydrogenase complex dihydrolipoamide acyltransferase (E2) component
MTTEFKLPLISEGVEAADIAAVHVHEGDVIQAGQIVFEVETEKAVAEIPAPQAGRVEKILVKQGQTVKIGQPLLTIDESAAQSASAPGTTAPPAAKTAAPATETKTATALRLLRQLPRLRNSLWRSLRRRKPPLRRRPLLPRQSRLRQSYLLQKLHPDVARLPTTDTTRRRFRPGPRRGVWRASWASTCTESRERDPADA